VSHYWRRSCECFGCRWARRLYNHDYHLARTGRLPRHPEKVTAWREADARGLAGALCDRIVSERPLPERLLADLARAFELD
jgi:hypothetical protein